MNKGLHSKISLIILIFPLIFACIEPQEFPPEPRIEFLSLSSDMVNEFDTLTLTLSFEDGDGDIGYSPNVVRICGSNPCDYVSDSSCYLNDIWSAILIDMRDSCYITPYNLPDIEPDGDIKAVSGEVDLAIPPIFCKQFAL